MNIKSNLLLSALATLMLSVGCSSTETPANTNDAGGDTAKPDTATNNDTGSQDTGSDVAVKVTLESFARTNGLSKLADALKANSLSDAYSTGTYTIFAPADTLTAPAVWPTTVSADVLKLHVVTSKVMYADASETAKTLTTDSGKTLYIKKMTGSSDVLVSSDVGFAAGKTAKVSSTNKDISFSTNPNVTIHVIDAILPVP